MRFLPCLRAACILIALYVSASASAMNDQPVSDSNSAQHTFVFVHGSTGGAWDWKEVGNLLEDKGHQAYRVTLTGLGEREHLAGTHVDLSTHVTDVVNTIVYEQLEQVVLVGHSYGGMVISGVMNQMPERIAHAIFLDAAVPDHGMTTLDVYGVKKSDLNVINGLIHFPWLENNSAPPHDVPHPLNSYLEKVSFDNPKTKDINTTFVAFLPDGVSKEQRANDDLSWQRAKQRGWAIRTFSGDHVIYRTKPSEVSEMLVDITYDKNGHANFTH